MIPQVTPLVPWLVQAALGGGLLLLLTWALMTRARQPALRQRLGELGLAAALLLALLALGPRWLTLPWAWPQETLALDVAAPGVELVAPLVEDAADPLEFAPPLPGPAQAPLVSTARLARLVPVVVAAYVGGALLLLLRWVVGHLALVRLLRQAKPAPAEVVALLRATVARARLPRLVVSTRARVPMSCGLVRPTIVLPATLCTETDAARLRWAFVHEMTHLERRDAWSCLLFGLGQAAFFYLPWFWPVRRQVRLCQEYVADAAAAEQGSVPDYAEFLLSLTGAPAVPLGATGVSGHSSDLFRRVTMLLQDPLRVETRCPRRRLLAAAAGLLGLAVVLAGVGAPAEAQSTVIIITDNPKEEKAATDKAASAGDRAEQKYFLFKLQQPLAGEAAQHELKPALAARFVGEQLVQHAVQAEKDKLKLFSVQVPARLPESAVESLKKAAERLRQHSSKEELEQVRKDLDKVIEQLRALDGRLRLRMVDSMAFTPDGKDLVLGLRTAPDAPPRLGVRVEVPSALVAEQLSLPEGQGLVVMEVYKDTPADKGGLKVNDILLELNGKAVPNDATQFAQQVRGLKPGAIGVVVLRKGKREEIKGVKLAAAPTGLRYTPQKKGLARQGQVTTTRTRRVEEFTTRYQDGKLTITIAGAMDGKTPQIAEISIQEGDGAATKYDSVAAVPAPHRQRVQQLIDAVPDGKGR